MGSRLSLFATLLLALLTLGCQGDSMKKEESMDSVFKDADGKARPAPEKELSEGRAGSGVRGDK